MKRHTTWVAAVMGLFTSPWIATAEDVRYYQDPNSGATYKESSQTIHRQMPVTQYQASTRTVLRGQYRTETQDVVRTYSVPVTEYRTESYWQGRYNPFVQPTLAHRTVPHTRWETRSEVVKVPVTRYETVPTTETVHVPVTTWHTVQDRVTHHTAVTPPTPGASAVVATPGSGSIGGVARLDPAPNVLGESSSGSGSSGSNYRTALAK